MYKKWNGSNINLIICIYTVVYMLNFTEYMVQLLELIELSKYIGYKIHIQKSFVFMYTKNSISNYY